MALPEPEVAPQEHAAATTVPGPEAPAPPDPEIGLQEALTDVRRLIDAIEDNIMDEDNENNDGMPEDPVDDVDPNHPGLRTPEHLFPFGSRQRRPEPTPCRVNGP